MVKELITSAVDSLRQTPAFLALVVLVLAVLGLIAWYANENEARNSRLLERLMDQCFTLVR
jgi:HAMP domain-containing protein